MRRFVAGASHELRTPIAVIRGEADVALSHDRGAAEYHESLAIVLDESRRLSRLVDDLLNLARADAGRVKLEVQEFYFNELLAECCRSMQMLASASDVALECRSAGDVQFRGDEALLRRLVINLLDNAIRYTPPGARSRQCWKRTPPPRASLSRIPESEFRRKRRRTFSSAFTGPTRRAPARTAASGWASRSRSGSPKPTTALWS